MNFKELYLVIVIYNFVKASKIRFCSVVVITPDFDLESEIPATPVRIWARPTHTCSGYFFPLFFRFSISLLYSSTRVLKPFYLAIYSLSGDMYVS